MYVAGELAREKLPTAQEKMKLVYDRRAERRQFSSGNQMLALLPTVGSPFQARFTGPHGGGADLRGELFNLYSRTEEGITALSYHMLKPYCSHAVEPGVTKVQSSECVQPDALANTVVRSPSQTVAVTEREESNIFDQALLCG